MCGILGSVGVRASDPALMAGLASIAHRGPDGQGVWQSTDGDVWLGHRRLSILDTSDNGSQPMRRGDLVMVFNGEIYNFVELRKELGVLGHQFTTGSDTEVLLAAFRQWGSECVHRFNGMWALAIWDCRKRLLFLSRDRFGKKPLFYSFQSGGLVFASEMKALAPLMSEFKPAAGFRELAENQFQYESSEQCLIDGIFRFPAGSSACCTLDDLKRQYLPVNSYWETRQHLVEVPVRYEEQVERFRELFLDACRLRMRSDVPVGTALSGGLDSSTVACAMAHAGRLSDETRAFAGDWQRAFVATFTGSFLDERHYAEAVLRKTGVRGEFIEINAAAGLERLPEYLYLFEELYPANPIPMMDMYHAISAAGVRVSIDGHGGDELLSGYGGFLQAMNDCLGNLSGMKQVLRCWNGKEAGAGDVLREFVGLHRGGRGALKFVMQWLWNRKRDNPRGGELGYLNSLLYENFHRTMLPTLLRNYDRYSMAAGVEIRMPFLDYRLVQFCFSLPWQSKAPHQNPTMKALLRDAFAQELPVEIRTRRDKIGFTSPIGDWLRGPWRPWLQDLLNSQSFRECDLIDQAAVRAMMDAVLAGTANHEFSERAWARLNPFLWQEHFLKRCQRIA
jgi:asparagine synthase (glutamine-hydrolysing)